MRTTTFILLIQFEWNVTGCICTSSSCALFGWIFLTGLLLLNTKDILAQLSFFKSNPQTSIQSSYISNTLQSNRLVIQLLNGLSPDDIYNHCSIMFYLLSFVFSTVLIYRKSCLKRNNEIWKTILKKLLGLMYVFYCF